MTAGPDPIPAPRRARRSLARTSVGAVLAAGLLLGAAACGSSAKSATSATTAAGATPTTAASATPSSAAATGGSSATTPTTAATASGGGGGSFCALLAGNLAKLAPTSPVGAAPATLQQDYAEYQKIEGVVTSSAPPAIKGDLETLFGYDSKFFAALAKVGYDPTKLAPSELESITANVGSIEPAAEAVSTYIEKSCGLDLTTPTT